MDRVIKFRAWQEDEIIYFNSVSLMHSYEKRYKLEAYDTSENGGLLHDDFIDKEYNEPTLMQFTGLTDRNGKEIYEGDIIKIKNKIISRVIYANGIFGWSKTEKLLNQEDKTFVNFHSLYSYLEEIEVIGNIYEHPLLLEGVK